jgi:hypothetical protein
MRLFTRIPRARLYEMLLQQRDIIEEQRTVVAEQLEMIEQQELQQIKVARDLIQNFHDALEAEVDEDTLRNGLEIALVDLNDHVARLEEHHV